MVTLTKLSLSSFSSGGFIYFYGMYLEYYNQIRYRNKMFPVKSSDLR
jgi:hypothetical protein